MVYRELSRRGLRLVPQVGRSGYRIDFGVLDDQIENRFIAGLECDGATYHEAATARDRDRLRQEVLENNLGWRLHRIWSTDWYHDRDSHVEHILSLVDESRSAVRLEEEERRRAKQKLEPYKEILAPVQTHLPENIIPDDAENVYEQNRTRTRSVPTEQYVLASTQILGAPDQFFLVSEARIAELLLAVV